MSVVYLVCRCCGSGAFSRTRHDGWDEGRVVLDPAGTHFEVIVTHEHAWRPRRPVAYACDSRQCESFNEDHVELLSLVRVPDPPPAGMMVLVDGRRRPVLASHPNATLTVGGRDHSVVMLSDVRLAAPASGPGLFGPDPA